MIPIALTIAGSDSSGGAGMQADLKTFSALEVYGASALAALTAQNTMGVTAIHEVPAVFVRAQMDAVYTDLDVRATKIGMLASAEIIEVVAEGITLHQARNVVLDPVMVASTGAALLPQAAVQALCHFLLPRADILTPNLHEAAVLLSEPVADSEAAMEWQARALRSLGPRAVLIKGGHASGAESIDVLVDENGTQRFASTRLETRNTHGTGCTLSSAIAAGLAKGRDLRTAVAEAKYYVTRAIVASSELRVGEGFGPVHHFYGMWGSVHERV